MNTAAVDLMLWLLVPISQNHVYSKFICVVHNADIMKAHYIVFFRSIFCQKHFLPISLHRFFFKSHVHLLFNHVHNHLKHTLKKMYNVMFNITVDPISVLAINQTI